MTPSTRQLWIFDRPFHRDWMTWLVLAPAVAGLIYGLTVGDGLVTVTYRAASTGFVTAIIAGSARELIRGLRSEPS